MGAQTTLAGEKVTEIIPGACGKYEKGQRCGGDLVEDPTRPNHYRCSNCNKITIIQVLQ